MNLLEIFHEWAEPLVSNYEEPTRKGTPRGAEIGFPRKKYRAAVIMALHAYGVFTQAELAEQAGISHVQARRWASEKKFSELSQDIFFKFKRFVAKELEECQDPVNKKKYIDIIRLSKVDYELLKVKWLTTLQGGGKIIPPWQLVVKAMESLGLSIDDESPGSKGWKDLLLLSFANHLIETHPESMPGLITFIQNYFKTET